MVLKIQDNKIPMDEINQEQARQIINAMLERFPALTDSFKKFGDAAKKGSAEFKKELEALSKQVAKGRAGYADQLRKLEELNDVIKELSDTGADGAKKSKLLQEREQLAREAANQLIKESAQEFGKSLAITATRSTGTFVKQLQVGASGTELSSTIMNAAIEATASTLNFASKGLQGFGSELLNKQGWLSQIGGAVLLGLGKGGEFVAEGGEKALKFANEVLSAELKKTAEAYSITTTAGAVFADGLTGMKNASVDAGLNLVQFSNLIKNNSASLAAAGGGVADGARKVGETAKILKNSGIQTQLQKLGFSIEEQANLSAEVMGRMARMGQSFDAGKLAKETQVYAENLRLIAAITGEDAKAKIKQVEEQNNILAFQNIIAQIGGEQAAHINEIMGTMSAADAKALRDRVINNGAQADIESAMYESLNTAAGEQNKAIYRLIASGNATADNVVKVQEQYAGAVIQGSRNMTDVGRAAFDTGDAMLTGVTASLLGSMQHSQKLLDGTFEKAKTAIKGAKDTEDPLTKGFVAASTAAQTLSVRLEDKLLPLLEKYTVATGAMLTGLQNLIDMAYGKTKTPGPKVGTGPNDLTGLSDDRRTNAQKAASDADVKAGRKSYNALGFDQPNVDPYEVGNRKGRANGGISRGPVSGYMELLHGTEAVVPLSDGRSIPVSLDSSSITAAVNQQSGILAEILRAMQNNNSLTSQIVQNSY
jgi:hypothetical protein